MNTIYKIFLNAVPVLLMIILIPIVIDDYFLAALYVVIIAFMFMTHRNVSDLSIFFFGLVIMTSSEYLFISTGVETFDRQTLFGLMPLWLPLLWGYGFVAIKRSVALL